MAINTNNQLICDCCGSLARNENGQPMTKLLSVYLGDSAQTIEFWCYWCYEKTFPSKKQKLIQRAYVNKIRRWGQL